MNQKVKLKAKGRKYYKNTHGTIYRVKARHKNITIAAYKKENRRLARLAAGALQKVKEDIEPSPEPMKEKLQGTKIIDIEGIGPVYAKKLNDKNIYTTTDLLEAGATPDKRKDLSQKTEISGQLLLRWINMADLFRINGVGEEYSDLLEASGVDTVVELSKRIPENLHAKMLQVNTEKNLVRRPPTLSQVEQWVQEAKNLPRKIHY